LKLLDRWTFTEGDLVVEMVYPIMCILPSNRPLRFVKDALVILTDNLMKEFLAEEGSFYIKEEDLVDVRPCTLVDDRIVSDTSPNPALIVVKIYHEDSTISYQNLNEIGITFGFTYSSRVLFLHETNLRNYSIWGIDPTLEENNDYENHSNYPNANPDASPNPKSNPFPCDDAYKNRVDKKDVHEKENMKDSIKNGKPNADPNPNGNCFDTSIALTTRDLSISSKLERGECHTNLYIKHIPEADGIQIGYGLYTSALIG
jgi:hypothetical protein